MIYRTLRDAELRRMIDNEPSNLAAAAEGVRRFLEGADEHKKLIEENERLESELSAAEDRESEAWARVSELEGD